MLDIVIPSKTERFLKRTIEDVLEKATGDITIYPVLDGYELPEEEIIKDPRVNYIHFPPTKNAKKRQAINHVAEIGKGDYLMSLDAHCMMAPGFDKQLESDHQPNWVQIPRRHRLDAENWCLQPQGDNRPPIDYEYIMFRPLLTDDEGMHGFKWDERTLARWNIPIDDTMEFQGSCWFMTKEWFQRMGFMDLKYQGWGQEAEEIGLTTRYCGGRVMTNKNTWYAHLHKGSKYGRMYYLDRAETRASGTYAFNFWVKERKDFFINFIEYFWPVPGWPKNWKDLIWAKKNQ